MGSAGLLLVMLTVAAPPAGKDAIVVPKDKAVKAGAKAEVAMTCASRTIPPPPKLVPLRAKNPTPAQRVMPDLH